MVRKHPHVKALTKQLTWKVKRCRSSNYRSSSPETAAALSSTRAQQSGLVPAFPSQLKKGLLGSEMLPGVGATVGEGKYPHDAVHVAWEVKGLRKSKA